MQQLPVYNVPPEVINASFKLFGLSVFQMVIMAVGAGVALFGMFVLPLDNLALRFLIGLILWAVFVGFFLVPLPALTAFEQLISYLNYRRANIPRQTSARPLPRLAQAAPPSYSYRPLVSRTETALPKVGEVKVEVEVEVE